MTTAAGNLDAKRLYLVRHPETDWNRQGRYQGRTGRPFSPDGEASVQPLVDYLHWIAPDTIVSSPTAHAAAVAEQLAARIGPETTIELDDAWCEVDHGDWEGLRHEEVVKRFGPGAARRFDDPLHYARHGGETLSEASRRVNQSWNSLVRNAGSAVVVISHATPISLVLCHCVEVSPSKYRVFRVGNSSVTCIGLTGDTLIIDSLNHRIEP